MASDPSPADAGGVVRVALPVPIHRLFDYLPPPGARPGVGCRVRVPFGRRELVGIVAGHGEAGPGTRGELKQALDCLDPAPLVRGELLASLQWLSRYTHTPLGEVLATALPAALRHGEPLPDMRTRGWQLTAAGKATLDSMRTGRPRQLAGELAGGALDEDNLAARVEGWRAAARSLAERGLAEPVFLDAPPAMPAPPAGPIPNEDQRAAIEAVTESTGFAPFLLDGVTGSGKTEVYLHAIQACLARGRQALVLVPEIGLTPQLLGRFRDRLGVTVHAYHSGLSDGERARTWAACHAGRARVVVGTRSAVFLPLPEPGLVVVDEEHDGSFKQLDGIRYHARDFALYRGKAMGVPVVLGSATPSLESLNNAQAGRYRHLRLHRRAGSARPPQVRVVDVRKRPLEAGLSPELLAGIGQALEAGGQVLVFRNRRGYAPVLLCHDCGWSACCARCSGQERGSPMTVHAAGRRLQCHHCGARRPAPSACPDCGGLGLQPQGAGTERIEEVLQARFPCQRVVRIDRGSTRQRDGLAQRLAEFGDDPGILVGTQMLAKGHDLPNLTLVAVVGIDEGLFSADFRAPEKLAQLLIQVAGRAGRAAKAGHVLLQTHHPDHPLLGTLLQGGYHAFAGQELELREAAGFPPFAYLALVRAEAKQVTDCDGFLRAARGCIEQVAGDALELSGPLPAPMPRRAGYQRTQLLLSSPTRQALHGVLDAALPAIRELPEARKVRWSLDVDPVDLY